MVLQASCYVPVRVSTSNIRVSPWLWYVGSMFPYGRFSNQVLLMPPEYGYREANDWYSLSDDLVMYPGVWTFLLAFVLAHACTRTSEQAVALQAMRPQVR